MEQAGSDLLFQISAAAQPECKVRATSAENCFGDPDRQVGHVYFQVNRNLGILLSLGLKVYKYYLLCSIQYIINMTYFGLQGASRFGSVRTGLYGKSSLDNQTISQAPGSTVVSQRVQVPKI